MVEEPNNSTSKEDGNCTACPSDTGCVEPGFVDTKSHTKTNGAFTAGTAATL